MDCDPGLSGRNVGRNGGGKCEWIDELVGQRRRLLLHQRERILVAQPGRRLNGPRSDGLHAGDSKSAVLEGAHECRADERLSDPGVGAGHEDTAVDWRSHDSYCAWVEPAAVRNKGGRPTTAAAFLPELKF